MHNTLSRGGASAHEANRWNGALYLVITGYGGIAFYHRHDVLIMTERFRLILIFCIGLFCETNVMILFDVFLSL